MRLIVSTSVPTFGDHLENIIVLSCGLLILVLALAIIRFLLNILSRACAASADWLEDKTKRRQRARRTCLKKYYPPVHSPHLRLVPPPDDSLAHNALRRAAEVHHVTQVSSSQAGVNLRLVRNRNKVK
jgi:hypothetical protein